MTGPNIISVVVCFTLVFLHSVASAKYEDTYIVRVSPPAAINGFSEDNYESYFQSFVSDSGSDEAERSRIVYSYRHVASGFAAKLSPEMVSEMRKKKGFISARPQKVYHTYTTHSPNFLGLHQNFGLWQNSSYGKGVIVGVLDTGITPNHPSFNDENMPPPPEKWKGTCAFEGSACNNKLIGARNFVSEVSPPPPPVDEEGHGTHTASTAAGNFVANVSVIGSAKGTAVGMAPLAHLSIYKVCTEDGCAESAILAAMDAAIEDGVDVLSLSLGGASESFFEDSIAVGAFAAMEKGIFVSCAAGNDGPDYSTLSNEAPWILTVGASTIDRTIKATAVLGNGEQLSGESAFQVHNFPPTLLPLVYPGAKDEDAALCGAGSLDKSDVKGKVVLCDRGGGIARVDKGKTVKEAGGAAMILVNQEIDGYTILADTHVLPATELSYNDGLIVKGYINSTTTTNSPPTATIVFKGTIIGTKTAPSVASFSSRGPNSASPGILKPDILGPGVNILAAWPFSVDNNTSNNGNATFNIISGTSMATPHLSGIAALLKSAHPDWSPAAIKSAIITTADQYNLNGSKILDERLVPADVFATGGGHVNPSRASDPGLIYDLNPDDYIPYLCGLNYTDQEIQQIVQRKVECSQVTSIPEAQLNYPSFAIWLGQTSLTYSRTVTNVGEANSMYTVKVSPIPGVDVGVTPDTLVFTEVNQKLTYNISFSPSSTPVDEDMVQGAIAWVSQNHIVKSPIALIFQ